MGTTKLTGLVALLTVAVLTAGCAGGPPPADDGPGGRRETVTIQLDYQLRGNHGMFHVADRLGYFAEQGIEIEEITLGTSSTDALRIVGTGRADFGFADFPTLVTSRSHDVPAKAVAAVNQSSPLAMCSVKRRVGLGTVKDLEGLTVGIHPAGSTYVFYEALLSANGVDQDRIKQASVTPPYENYLMRGKVDAVPCYIDAEVPLLEAAAGGPGSLSILLGADAGYDVYGSGLITSDRMIEERPELVQRFTNAYLEAFDYVVSHPAETAKLLAATSPVNADKGPVFEQQLQADIDRTFTSDATRAKGLGAMEEAKWRTTIDTLTDQGMLKGRIEPEDVYDPTFVDAYHADR